MKGKSPATDGTKAHAPASAPATDANGSDLHPPSFQDNMLDEINRELALTWMNGNLLALWTEITEDNGLPRFSKNMGDLKNWFSPRSYHVLDKNGKEKKVNPISVWLESKHRREFDGIVFRPGCTDTGKKFNLFRGWPITPNPRGDCRLFLAHLRDIVCGGDADVFDYLMQWLANIFQKPEDRPGTALALQGVQGAGKGVISKYLKTVLGMHLLTVAGGEQLLEKFNSDLKIALLVFGDETVWPGDKKGIEKLKSWITEDTIMIEPKYVNKFQINCYARFMFTTNRDHSAPAELGDRRFVPLNVSDAHADDPAYWNRLHAEREAGGPAALLHHLLHVVKLTRNLRVTPKTEALLEQKILSLDTVGTFVHELLMSSKHQLHKGYERDSPALRPNLNFGEATMPVTVHAFYLQHCQRGREGYPKALAAFSKAFRKYIDVARREASKGQRNGPEDRTQRWLMPTLVEGRAQFEKALGGRPISWPADPPSEEIPMDDLSVGPGHRASKSH
jgi:hypothetical protein